MARSARPRPAPRRRTDAIGASRTSAGGSARSRGSAAGRTSARPQRRAGARRPPARLGRDRLYLAGIGLLLLGLGAMATGPYGDYVAAQDRVDTLISQREALDASVERLEAEAERLQDPAALEEQARSQLGLVRPGEIPYIVVNPPVDPPAPVNANPDLGEDDARPLFDRFVEWISGLWS